MAEITVDIDLDEFSDSDLIEEIESRRPRKVKKVFYRVIQTNQPTPPEGDFVELPDTNGKVLNDQLKTAIEDLMKRKSNTLNLISTLENL